MKIGIFGGTFNPPHIGHINLARTSSIQLGLDLVIVVPAGVPPHKNLPDNTPQPDKRLAMVIEAFSSLSYASVSDLEIFIEKPVYTVNTIREISRIYPGAELFLMMGTDMFLTLETWRESRELLRMVKPVVFIRSLGDDINVSDYAVKLCELYAVEARVISAGICEISSSQLRDMLPLRNGAGYITDTTYSYIIKHRLYNAKPDWDWLREKADMMLDPARVPHVNGCESTAIKLAARWGADPDDTREAAILHDITKKLSIDDNIEILEQSGVPRSDGQPGIEVELSGSNEQISRYNGAGGKLLHSMTGAIVAKNEFGVSDAVAEAIRWHTTGRPGMTTIEKVLYIADYIEPARDFEGVGRLRELADNDLNKAVIAGLEMCIDDLTGRGIEPDTMTLEALKYLKEETI